MNETLSVVIRLSLSATVLAMFFLVIINMTDMVDDLLGREFMGQYNRINQMTSQKMSDYSRMKYINSGLVYLFIEEFHDKIASFQHFDKNGTLLENKDLTLYYSEYSYATGSTKIYSYHKKFLVKPQATVKIQINDSNDTGNGTVVLTIREVN